MSIHGIAQAGAAEIAAAVRAGGVSAVAVIEATLARIAERDGATNCFTEITAERALAEARAVDTRRADSRDPGPLAGVPFAVKNLFDLAGVVTLAGSRIDAERPPATADATIVQRLIGAGAVPVGALNMDEYAYGFTTENSHYGPTRNPFDRARVAGGSSGGSAAAVGPGSCRSRSVRTQTARSVSLPRLRCLRAEADLRPAKPRRREAVRGELRPCRAVRPLGQRPRHCF
jgi:Asp-tRNA(Asn)/Glu-tRNA(Gln) amidotransferase A subunit family amidase